MKDVVKNTYKIPRGLCKEISEVLEVDRNYVWTVLNGYKGKYKCSRGKSKEIKALADRLMAEREALRKEYKKA